MKGSPLSVDFADTARSTDRALPFSFAGRRSGQQGPGRSQQFEGDWCFVTHSRPFDDELGPGDRFHRFPKVIGSSTAPALQVLLRRALKGSFRFTVDCRAHLT
mmetsp:Transcript_34055/g.105172  ORF Transcript_34055/g.105172 Transcript_34055/m.105172 type:complete len:103 (-) Transcript_34055:550-858(-)